MTKYISLTFGSVSYLFYKLLTLKVYGGIMPRNEYFAFLAPILVSVSAGLFLTRKTKSAGIFGLAGLVIASKDILSNWLILNLVSPPYKIQLYAFVILTTAYLFFLIYITVKALINQNKDHLEIAWLQPSEKTAKIIGFIPTVIVVVVETWFTLTYFK